MAAAPVAVGGLRRIMGQGQSAGAAGRGTIVVCSRDHDHLSTGTMSDHEGGRAYPRLREPGARGGGSWAPQSAAISAARLVLILRLAGS